jgi:DNA-directed RNA polymerase subunit delta
MIKKRGIISYDKLTVDQKEKILKVYPNGYFNHLTQIKTPNGETLDAFIWETDDVIYLVKVKHSALKHTKNINHDEDEFEDELEKEEDIEDPDIEDSMSDSEEEEDEYDKPNVEEDDSLDEES